MTNTTTKQRNTKALPPASKDSKDIVSSVTEPLSTADKRRENAAKARAARAEKLKNAKAAEKRVATRKANVTKRKRQANAAKAREVRKAIAAFDINSVSKEQLVAFVEEYNLKRDLYKFVSNEE